MIDFGPGTGTGTTIAQATMSNLSDTNIVLAPYWELFVQSDSGSCSLSVGFFFLVPLILFFAISDKYVDSRKASTEIPGLPVYDSFRFKQRSFSAFHSW